MSVVTPESRWSAVVSAWGGVAVAAAAVLAVMLLYGSWIGRPHLRYDDFNFLTKSLTPAQMRANLWLPMNDHVMPLARLAAGGLMYATPRQSDVPRSAQMHAIAAVLVGMGLLFVFVRRETGHPFHGLVAMIAWGVTTSYVECVTWYSASFFTLAAVATLTALLTAQRHLRSGSRAALVACASCCALAPAVHGSALLAGPWCALYLAWERRGEAPRRLVAAATPLLGLLVFVAVSLVATKGSGLQAAHYRGKSVFEAFSPVEGALNTLRTLADNQLPGAFGIWNKTSVLPWPVVLAVAGALLVLAILWWRAAPNRRLLALGLAITLSSDFLVYGGRATWSYEGSVHNWTRYHLFPHLGLVLFVAGGLPQLARRWPTLSPGGWLTIRHIAVLLVLVLAVLAALACHFPRSRNALFQVPPGQMAVLRRVERVDRLARAVGIDAATAREALGFLQFPLGFRGDNAWDFLRGSEQPRPFTVDEARQLLEQLR